MADAVILFDEEVAGTLATDTNWVDMALIPAASFEASTEYIVLAVASARHASAANETRVRLVRGATPTILTDASLAWEGLSGTQRHQVQWMRRFTQPGTTEDLKIQMSSSSTTDVNNDYSAIIAFKASDLGTENTDWFWNEDTADYTMTGTPTAKASETFTPNGTDRWLIIGEMTWDAVSITTPIGFELHDGTSVLKSMQQEAEDATNDFLSAFLVWAGVPTNSSKTYSVRPFNSGSSIALSNRIFALNLSRFAQSASDFTAAEVAPAASPSWTNVATVAITPSTTGDFVIIGDLIADVGTTTDNFNFRMQVNNGGGLASDPAYGDDAPGIDNWDATDEVAWTFLKKRSLTSGASRTINLDAQMAAGTTMRAEDRALVVFSVALAAGGGVTATPDPVTVPLVVPAPTVTAGRIVTPSALALPLVLPTPVVTAGRLVLPSPVAIVLAIPVPTVEAGAGSTTVTPDPVAVSLILPTPTVTSGRIVTPSAVAIPLVLPAPTIGAGRLVLPDPVAIPLLAVAPVITAGRLVLPDPVTIPLVLPTPSVSAGAFAVTVTPSPVAIIFLIPDPIVSSRRRATFGYRRVHFLGVPDQTAEELYEDIFGDLPDVSFREY